MTISEHITLEANGLDLKSLTPEQSEWLHFVRNLAMTAYIARKRRELSALKRAA